MNARAKAVNWALDQVKAKRVVMMGYRGEVVFDRELRCLKPHKYLPQVIYDCSGLYCGAVKAAGGPDMLGTHNAQRLHDEMRELAEHEPPMVGDGVFYGKSSSLIIHVGIWCVGGKVISADGATWGIVDLETAKAARAQVRLREDVHFRGDFISIRRATVLDDIDKVTR